MSLEPIEPEAALELFLKDKEAELADASIKGHDYRLRHFVRWCHEQGIENLNTLTDRGTVTHTSATSRIALQESPRKPTTR